MKRFVFMVLGVVACAFAASLRLQPAVAAVPRSTEAAVIKQDMRWLDALMKGDRGAINSILAPGYKHVNSDGVLLDRDQELATANEPAPPMKWTELTVDFAGGAAIVHGLNTMTVGGKVERERFTDVFVHQNGAWLAIAAQETRVK